MDDEQFQQLVAMLKSAANRREIVRGLVAGALVSVGIITEPSPRTRAQNRCKKNGKNCVEAENLQYNITGRAGNDNRRRRRRRD